MGKVALGVLAASLAVTAGTPAITGGLAKERHGGVHRQEQSVVSDARGQGEKRGSRTVTRSFASESLIAIPGSGEIGRGDPYPSTLQVVGFKKARILDVDVTLRDLEHEFPQDIDVLLVAPGGRSLVVMSDSGGGIPVSNLTLEFDDEANAALPFGQELENGPFRPTNGFDGTDDDFPAPAPAPGNESGILALSTFNGISPNGEWRLFVIDDGTGNPGGLSDGWELTITAKENRKKKR
jgi:hypothetical protein